LFATPLSPPPHPTPFPYTTLFRSYTEAQRAEALAALQANGGNLSATSRQTGIPASTIRDWRDTPDHLTELRDEKKRDLALAIEELAHRIVEVMPDRVHDANFQHLAVALGIAVDKLRLLRGEATNIEEVRGSDAKHELAERLARLTTRPAVEPSPPN